MLPRTLPRALKGCSCAGDKYFSTTAPTFPASHSLTCRIPLYLHYDLPGLSGCISGTLEGAGLLLTMTAVSHPHRGLAMMFPPPSSDSPGDRLSACRE